MLSLNGENFTTGCSTYVDNYPGDITTKIRVKVKFSTLPICQAILDTGSPYPILLKEQADVLKIDLESQSLRNFTLDIRGNHVVGSLIRLPVTLIADEGDSLEIESTVFIPDEELTIPNFIGYDGLLQRVRFAINPLNGTNKFYFGQ